MNVTLKLKILVMVGIITLASLLGCILLIYNARVIGNSLRLETEKHIKALIGRNAERTKTILCNLRFHLPGFQLEIVAFLDFIHI